MTNTLSFVLGNAPPPPPVNVARQDKDCETSAYQHWSLGGRGWLVECDIEGVVGKVTPVFKYSQPFLSKIVVSSKISWSTVSKAALKFNNTKSDTCPLSIFMSKSFITYNNGVSVL